MKNYFIAVMFLSLAAIKLGAQNHEQDSLIIQHYEDNLEPDKVLHAEPLYIDLIRDLGARKGEKEWNVGLGLTDKLNFDSYEALIEYEWAPINRLGFEIELPFTFYSTTGNSKEIATPKNQLNSLKLATQWSFLVDEKNATSMALGYIHEFELYPIQNKNDNWFKGNLFNPFFVAAKRWGTNFHTLVYTGTKIEVHKNHSTKSSFEINSNFHYMISGTKNFIGVEFNKTVLNQNFDLTIRPQMRLGLKENLMVGIIAGIPVSKTNERLSSFIRLIWEPAHKH